MNKLLSDALSLALLRVKPLSHYVYPFWLPMVWLTLIAAMMSPGLPLLNASLPAKFLVVAIVQWVEVLVLTFVMSWWLKLGNRWNGDGSLFPLIVVASTVQLLGIAVSALDLVPLALIAAIYRLVVLVHAIAGATGVRKSYVVGGILVFLPVAVVVTLILAQIAVGTGMIELDPAMFGPADLPGNDAPAPNKA
ncbi:hypothetical protein [Parachitinimonas caeni]|uniref:Yip1 domain-containing protein n=1 Tax=Parachitinimonas caeni TaxID=3031301 RepID=A0ABT7E0L5_9NEIS|nr:hypothetical protein [Parachitinimonas caeni]MDK2125852.1 hypothetical protein [Parachitinimonas caeni]